MRIWCAACSTGQECYSIAIVLSELLPNIASWNINILGTDIADASIAQASRGTYSTYEIGRGMPPQYLHKYMAREGANWRVRDPLRALVRFDRRNLLENFHDLGPFDVIFCRNVAIYFDPPTRQNLFLRLADRLTPAGYLFVGAVGITGRPGTALRTENVLPQHLLPAESGVAHPAEDVARVKSPRGGSPLPPPSGSPRGSARLVSYRRNVPRSRLPRVHPEGAHDW